MYQSNLERFRCWSYFTSTPNKLDTEGIGFVIMQPLVQSLGEAQSQDIELNGHLSPAADTGNLVRIKVMVTCWNIGIYLLGVQKHGMTKLMLTLPQTPKQTNKQNDIFPFLIYIRYSKNQITIFKIYLYGIYGNMYWLIPLLYLQNTVIYIL